MDSIRSFAETWFRDLLAKDPWAVALGAGLFVAGSVLTTAGARLGGRATFALAGLAWRGLRRLFRRKPLGQLALTLLETMNANQPREERGRALWYGDRLHFFGDQIWVDPHTRIDQRLTRAERKRLLRAVEFDRQLLAERKIMALPGTADGVEANPYAAM